MAISTGGVSRGERDKESLYTRSYIRLCIFHFLSEVLARHGGFSAAGALRLEFLAWGFGLVLGRIGMGMGMAWHEIIPSLIWETSQKSFGMCGSVFCVVDMVSYL
jgi:hypothetical protein